MKTRIFIQSAICILAAASVSCTKEENLELDEKSVMEPFFINATTDVASKTSISDIDILNKKAYIVWNENDNISVFSTNLDSHLNNEFKISNITGSSAKFSGEVESGTKNFVALYPYSSALSYSDGVISNAQIPTSQSATPGSFAIGSSLAIASGTRTDSSTTDLSFTNLCAVLSFTLPSNITFAKEITISSKTSTPMAGTVTIDGKNQAITSATATSVKLTGSFTGGNTYYVAVAPGTHSSGFSFTIKTNGGNTYSRETTKDITAAAGKIYPLGTLSLALPQDALSTSVTISHNVSSNTLNGSTAKFTLTNNKSEFAGLVTKYKAVVNLKSGSTVVRTLTNEGTSISNVSMSIANGYYYLPKGSYTYDATITYTVNNGTKDVTRELKYSGSATSPQPSGFSLDANLSGYTSYSVYKGTDGQTASATNANNLDNATIYGIGASYKSGLSSNVYNQYGIASKITISSTLDGTAASGNQGSKSWAAHTVGATWSFDGASGTCASTKTVYVTGLPFKDNGSLVNTKNYWTISGNNEWQKSYLELWKGGNATSKSFVLPQNVNVNVNGRFKLYSGSSYRSSGKIIVGGTTIADETYKVALSGYEEYTPSKDIIISNNSVVYLEGYAHIWSASYASTVAQFFTINVIYRE